MDVKTAFRNGDLKEEIYMELPDGLKTKNPNLVCKLKKSLYGLKQAARCWYDKFDSELKSIGFTESLVDPCVYFIQGKNVKDNVYILLYVDDVVIITGNMTKLNQVKSTLMKKFEMSVLQDIKLFLGIRICRTQNSITLDQTNYINQALAKFRMVDSRSATTPMEVKVNHLEMQKNDSDCKAPIRSALGCLRYIMLQTRPDISIAVNILSEYQNVASEELWQNIKRVFRYLNGTKDLKLTYEKCPSNSNLLVGFADSDYGGQFGTERKSTTGYLFKAYDKSPR